MLLTKDDNVVQYHPQLLEDVMALRYQDMTPEQRAKRLEAQRRYRLNHPDRVKKAKEKWFKKNPDYFNRWAKQNYRKRPIKALLRAIKTKAKKEGVPFNLTESDIVIPSHCPILGIELVPYGGSLEQRGNNHATLDRVIPSKGYVRGNVHVISFRANRLKNNATIEEIEKIIAYMEARLNR